MISQGLSSQARWIPSPNAPGAELLALCRCGYFFCSARNPALGPPSPNRVNGRNHVILGPRWQRRADGVYVWAGKMPKMPAPHTDRNLPDDTPADLIGPIASLFATKKWTAKDRIQWINLDNFPVTFECPKCGVSCEVMHPG